VNCEACTMTGKTSMCVLISTVTSINKFSGVGSEVPITQSVECQNLFAVPSFSTWRVSYWLRDLHHLAQIFRLDRCPRQHGQ
jgi:hypothetical protein